MFFFQAKQGLNNWRAGFASAAITSVTTTFACDRVFEDPQQRIEFARAMLPKNRFLFNENKGLDVKV